MTPFELNISEQPSAMRAIAGRKIDSELCGVLKRNWERIIFTGMGSSHYVAHPLWRHLVAHGLPAWNIDSGLLLDSDELVTPKTLLIATSQSGASGEIIELLSRRYSGTLHAGYVLGITANNESPLAKLSDGFVNICSGDEATVSTKSYLNSLSTLHSLREHFASCDEVDTEADILDAADNIQALLETIDVEGIAKRAIAPANYRLATLAKGSDVATAFYAALITKESSKVAIEGYAGGEFRHGPFELAGPGLTTFIYGINRQTPDIPLQKLMKDVLKTGANVVSIGDDALTDASLIDVNSANEFCRLAVGAVVAQRVAVEMARANGVEPGAFAYGSKVTSL